MVIDDVGFTPLDRGAGNAFFQLVNRRYENGSATIVTTKPRAVTGALFRRTPWVASAINDRP